MLILLFHVLFSQLVCIFPPCNYRKRRLVSIGTLVFEKLQHGRFCNIPHSLLASVVLFSRCNRGTKRQVHVCSLAFMNPLVKLSSGSGPRPRARAKRFQTLFIKPIVVIASQNNTKNHCYTHHDSLNVNRYFIVIRQKTSTLFNTFV